VQRCELVQDYLEALDLAHSGPDFGFLNALIRRHVATFAFSSAGCRLGDDLPLDFESLYRRIVLLRRGGYCFEQNGLLYEVLEELGYSPELYLARVIYNKDIHPGLTHRISVVQHQGQRYVMDVGFGPLGPRAPVQFSDLETDDGGRVFRIAEKRPGEYHMQVHKDGDFFSLYRFELTRYGQADCELGHFFSHKHPDAAFVNHLVVSLILADETRSLRDLEYCVFTESGARTSQIGCADQLGQILVEELGVQVSGDESRQLFDDLNV
jgi:N-hydroxyarylamine O-acetyltransferase